MWVILLAAVVGVVVWYLLTEDESPLDRLPGPARKPVIGCALEFLQLDSKKLFVLIRQSFQKYGDRFVVKFLSRRILHVRTPEDIEAVLSHSKNITKSLPYTFLQPWLGTGLLLSTGSKWHKRRKILTPTFHFNILKNFSIIMEEKSRDFVEKMKLTGGGDVNIVPEISDFTLFTICETAMGTQLDKDQSAKTVEYKSAIQDIGQIIVLRLIKAWLRSDLLFNLSAQGRRYNECLRKVHDFADNVIEERRKQRGANSKEFSAVLEGVMGSKRRLAMLDLLLEAEDKGEIDLDGIREEVNTFMFEGYDTTAMALTFALMLLADHEEVQERIYEECEQTLGGPGAPPAAAWADLKYLDAVIKEVLRLYPSVPFIARTVTEDFALEGLEVPRGAEVAVHIYDLHRRPDLFPEPDRFLPDRFLPGAGEHRHPFAYVPFSAGPRNCIGQKFAQMELKCLLSSVCRSFRLQPREAGAQPELGADLVLRPAAPLYVRFLPR